MWNMPIVTIDILIMNRKSYKGYSLALSNQISDGPERSTCNYMSTVKITNLIIIFWDNSISIGS